MLLLLLLKLLLAGGDGVNHACSDADEDRDGGCNTCVTPPSNPITSLGSTIFAGTLRRPLSFCRASRVQCRVLSLTGLGFKGLKGFETGIRGLSAS